MTASNSEERGALIAIRDLAPEANRGLDTAEVIEGMGFDPDNAWVLQGSMLPEELRETFAAESLEQMRQVIDCEWVDKVTVPIYPGLEVDVWFDDEGMIRGRKVNPIASALAGVPICGNVVIAGFDREGNTVMMTQDEALAVIERVGNAIQGNEGLTYKGHGMN